MNFRLCVLLITIFFCSILFPAVSNADGIVTIKAGQDNVFTTFNYHDSSTVGLTPVDVRSEGNTVKVSTRCTPGVTGSSQASIGILFRPDTGKWSWDKVKDQYVRINVRLHVNEYCSNSFGSCGVRGGSQWNTWDLTFSGNPYDDYAGLNKPDLAGPPVLKDYFYVPGLSFGSISNASFYEWETDDSGFRESDDNGVTFFSIKYLVSISLGDPIKVTAKTLVQNMPNQLNKGATVAEFNMVVDSISVELLPQSKLPIADFTYQPLSPHPDEMVTFDSGSSIPGISPIKSYKWNFGDPDSLVNEATLPATSQTIQHPFPPGTYTVTLTVEDASGHSDSIKKTITVLPETHDIPHDEKHEQEDSVTPTPSVQAEQPGVSQSANPSKIIITPPGIITPNPGIITPNPGIITPNPGIITPTPIVLPVTPISPTPLIITQPAMTINGIIKPSGTDAYIIPINTAPRSMVFLLKLPGSDMDLVLKSPSGKRYALENNTTNGVVYYKNTSQSYSYYFIDNPEKGNWTVDAIAVDVNPMGENYSISLIDTSRNSTNPMNSLKSIPSTPFLITAFTILIAAFLIASRDNTK